ncbi:MAG: hypothetical protein MK161_16500, partial [Pirellulales bacterium]|nr:hypothetical protein [Pirellulales bacterium]
MMKHTTFFLVTIVVSFLTNLSFTLASSVPEAYVPFSSVKIDLDGRLSDTEWDDAAMISDLRLMGSSQPLPQGTRFYLKHDGESLLVAVRSFETTPGYPKAS